MRADCIEPQFVGRHVTNPKHRDAGELQLLGGLNNGPAANYAVFGIDQRRLDYTAKFDLPLGFLDLLGRIFAPGAVAHLDGLGGQIFD